MQKHNELRYVTVKHSQHLVKENQLCGQTFPTPGQSKPTSGRRFPTSGQRKPSRSNIPNSRSKKTKPVKDSQLPVKENQVGQTLPTPSQRKPTSGQRFPTSKSFFYFQRIFSSKTFCRYEKSSYLWPRYKHFVKPLCMTRADGNPTDIHHIGGSLFPHCQQRTECL